MCRGGKGREKTGVVGERERERERGGGGGGGGQFVNVVRWVGIKCHALVCQYTAQPYSVSVDGLYTNHVVLDVD